MKKHLGTILNIISIIGMLYLGWKFNSISQSFGETKTIIEKTEKVIEKPIVTKITKAITVNGSDTTIYITSKDSMNTPIRIDSLIAHKGGKIYQDTINLDSSGVVYGVHLVSDDTMRSKYLPILKERTTTITNTVFKPPAIELYSTIGTDGSLGLSLNGVNYKKKVWTVGYSYNPINNQHIVRSGIRIFNF